MIIIITGSFTTFFFVATNFDQYRILTNKAAPNKRSEEQVKIINLIHRFVFKVFLSWC